MPPFVTIETKSSQPVQAPGRRLTLFSQAVKIQFPGVTGGLIWNRPASVLVVSDDGQEQIIPVPDITRQIQWGLAGLCAAALILTALRRRK
jgi:hypothetical protein